jgi:opacity protein-like surface antigen
MHIMFKPVRSFFCSALLLLALPMVSRAALSDNLNGEWNFNMGGGFTPVVGGMNSQLTSGWNYAVGTGYDFDEKFGVLLEYGSHYGGVEDGVLSRYNSPGNSTEGSTHIWSLTLNPKWNFKLNHVVGGYLIGGGGYYHANAQVTSPTVAFVPGYCDPWWGCWPGGLVPADKIIAERKDDTGGVNVGMGLTFDLWRDVQFYLETRYHHILIHGSDIDLLPLTAGFRF